MFQDKIYSIWRKYTFNDIDYYHAKTIESMTFYDSICAIKKFSAPKNILFKSVTTEDKQDKIIGVRCFKDELEHIQRVKDIYGA
jgi:hypothetical protein